MLRLFLKCFDQLVQLQTNSHEVLQYARSLEKIHVFPLTKFAEIPVQENVENAPTLVVINGNGTAPSISYDTNSQSITLQTRWSSMNRSGTLENLLYQLLCVSAIENHIYLLHGSAIMKNEQAVLILGDIGAGKTSLSMSLCLNHGFQWLANDQVGLQRINDCIYITQGYDTIDFRKLTFSNLSKYLPKEIISIIQPRLPSQNTPFSKTKPPFQPEEVGLERGKIPAKVHYVVFSQILDGVEEYCGEIGRLMASWSIAKEVARMPRGVEVFLRDNDGYMLASSISVEPRNGWNAACDFINSVYDICKVSIVFGSIEFAQYHIANWFKGE